jgi:phosphate starvation-inducible protein PhoH and related proteins
LTQKGAIEFITTSFVRGITLDNCVVIVDEVQSMSVHEIFSILSRVGENCQLFVCGDTRQSDLNPKRETSCYDWLIRTSEKMPDWFSIVHHYPQDIVRSEFCKALILATEE